MTIEEQITIFEHNAEHERKEGDLHNCLNFRQLAQWLKELKSHREAWENVEKELKKENQRFANKTNFASGYIEGIREALFKMHEYRPKEGESNI